MDTLGSVLRPVRELRPGDHAWLAYANEEERRHVVGAFVREGLAAGHKVIYVAPPAGAVVPGASQDRAPGLLTVVPLDPGDPPAAVEAVAAEISRGAADGHRGIRVAADLTWAVRGRGGLGALLEYERRIERAVGPSICVIAVCQVDRRRCDAAALRALHAHHAVRVAPDPEFEDSVLRIVRTFQPAGLSLCGELDASRHTVLDQALSTVLSGAGTREIHLDLAGLGFIDLGAINILADVAGRHAGRGPLVLDRVPAQLRTVMETVGWGMLPGLCLGRGPAPGSG